MPAIILSRILTFIIVAGGGMLVAHLAQPYAPTHRPLGPFVFLAFIALLGYTRGLRDATVRGGFSPRARTIRASLVAVGSVALAVAAFIVVHGNPLP